MNSTRNSATILLAALLATMLPPVFGADAEGDPGQDGRTATPRTMIIQALEGMHTGNPAIRLHAKQVKGAPYSAEVVTERQQNLADGNQIASKTTSLSYRDSAGRTRQEVHDAKGEMLTVAINDPVAGVVYMLNPRTKTGTKIMTNVAANVGTPEARKAAAEAARARLEQLRKDGKLLIVEGRKIIIRQADEGGGDVKLQLAPGAGLRLEADNVTTGPNGDMMVRLGPLTGAMADMKWAAKTTTKDLGTRDIEGIKAEGKLRSYEIPAGEVGNRNAITVSDESWYSPELQVTVMSKHSDPRAGENVYRLTAIKREEPAAALFAPPPDYTIRDRTPDVHLMEKKAP
jgi:hypothetical protein